VKLNFIQDFCNPPGGKRFSHSEGDSPDNSSGSNAETLREQLVETPEVSVMGDDYQPFEGTCDCQKLIRGTLQKGIARERYFMSIRTKNVNNVLWNILIEKKSHAC
jgi:hypothetical protein